MNQADETAYIIEDSALERECDLWFAVPPGYVEIPLGNLFAAPDSPEGARMIEAVKSILALVPTESRADFLSQLATAQEVAGIMIREGVVHVSIGAHEAEDGQLLESVLTLTRREVPFSPPKLAAMRAATSRQSVLPVAVLDLPCGPGAFVEALIKIPADADPQQRSIYETTAYLPFPDGRNLAVLTLTTTAVDAWEHYRDIHRGIAETVSFDNPLLEDIKEQIPESEVVASVRAVFG